MPGPAWIVLPTYCEAENLEPMADALRAALPADARILVVDDASPDGTGAIADRLAAADPRVAVLHRAGKQGLGPAYVAGFGHALAHGAGAVVEMDCDFSHDPAVVPALLGALDDGADLALGSRYVGRRPGRELDAPGAGPSRARGCLYAQAVLRAPVRDLTGGFKAFRAEALARDRLPDRAREGLRVPGGAARTARCGRGCGSTEVPIVFRERREGESKMSGAIALEAAWRVPGAAPPVPRARAADVEREMNTEQLALVRGWADTRATLRAGSARPLPVVGAWALRQPRRRRAAADRDLDRRASLSVPGPAVCSRASAPGEWSDFAFILYRNGLVLALHALACVAGFIAGLVAARRRRGLQRLVAPGRTTSAGKLAMGFVGGRDAVLALHAGVRARRRRRRAVADAQRRLAGAAARLAPPARAPRADRALPPARGLAARQPPRRMGRAPGGDLRHDGDRDPGHHRRRGGRGLGLARTYYTF